MATAHRLDRPWRHWRSEEWSERPQDASVLQLWAYTGKPSYVPGETVTLNVSTSAETFDVRVVRDGVPQVDVAVAEGLRGRLQDTPSDAYSAGCRWQPSYELVLPGDAKPGGYLVHLSAARDGVPIEGFAFFAVRAPAARRPRLAVILSTYTWASYNDWGGACGYAHHDRNAPLGFAPQLSLDRPWARGLLDVPAGSPRIALGATPPLGWAVRHPWAEWAYANGYSLWSAAAGWARYDAHMVHWLEKSGYTFDVLTQWDLDRDAGALDDCDVVVTCGHDEYWSATGRAVLDRFLARGGRHARFGGNIAWRVRLEDDETTLSSYKWAELQDPVAKGRTGLFEGRRIGHPPVTTFGANGAQGAYAGWGGAVPRGCGGFVVYRPSHWAFAGADLYYGDVLGAAVHLVGYECDGVDYGFSHGLPHPTGADGTPVDGTEILALTPVTLEEEDHGIRGSTLQMGSDDLETFAQLCYGSSSADELARLRYGSAVITHIRLERGEIFCAGTTEWPFALAVGDPQCAIVTRNVLDRFLSEPVPGTGVGAE